MFADYILIFLTSPTVSAPTLLDILSKFELILGPLNKSSQIKSPKYFIATCYPNPITSFVTSCLVNDILSPFLGYNISANPIELYATNYLPMLSQLKLLTF